MMGYNKNIFNILSAIVFSLAILMPIGVKTVHLFAQHDHKVCIDGSTHFHAKQLECNIYDFHFSTFCFSPHPNFQLDSLDPIQIGQTSYFRPEITTESRNYLLRGPPLFT